MSTPARPPAPGRLGTLQDFLNTHDTDRQVDELGELATARAAIAVQWPGVGAFDDAARLRLIEVREALRDYLRTPRPPGGAARLRRITTGTALAVDIRDDGTTALVGAGEGVAEVVGGLLATLHDAEATGALERFKICSACDWAFYDASRNRSSRWCEMSTCGSREKMRAYRSRKREGTAG